MAKKVKRTKTKHKNIYLNESTNKYDVKYNYKVYNPTKQKNDYRAKWIYNIGTIAEAKKQLAILQAEGLKAEDKDITLEGIFALWNKQAIATNKSKVTVRNTEQQFNMLIQVIPKDTKLKNITDDVYYETFAKIKEKGYAEETIHSLNSCFRKLINLAYKKSLIKENPLHRSENVKTETKNSDDYRILTHEEYKKIDNYLHNTKFVRLGIDRYVEFRFFFNLLYYTGMRVVTFAKATGCRRCDLEKLTPAKFYTDRNDVMWVKIEKSKGGRDRIAPILPKYREYVEKYLVGKDRNTKLFHKISHSADIHGYRGDYARELYKAVEQDKDFKDKILAKYPTRHEYKIIKDKETGESRTYEIQSGTYTTRGENKQTFDRDEAYICTCALGHERLEVTVTHYLKQ